ncbi:hypothetical protein CC1G_15459 [Coprinopsis cinerea okayama7|uniref:Uncharacterized protein n=1 Tax=Coprinopsis cinerea (strain Okayama-7 / 130 / ATCC MYA-4618 / FGSC 9003) TaxID=240176 RepID=D6RQQ1_COPC7|nr:hypothetical protein CC1G_15459 [Coprinopsis cinerea okayama7\|eukprot:XP_002910182.1 hypothetical protein CC1G_15459 [Coprinopsis cinerea okayama7\
MAVPDLLHEFELGVGKEIFIHLIRILNAYDPAKLQQLNDNYRAVPTYGRNTIRRFPKRVSDMRKLAGRDYEDIIQCAVACFDGLLPKKHNTVVLDLLFELATWHGLAKLRLHTSTTLNALETSTTRLGQRIRRFISVTCSAFDTRALPKEILAKAKRRAKAQLGRYGTTDGYSTQTGECEHRRVKKLYEKSDRRDYTQGIAKLQRRERIMHQFRASRKKGQAMKTKGEPLKGVRASVDFDIDEPLPDGAPDLPYQMSHETKRAGTIRMTQPLRTFYRDLLTHLRLRLMGLPYDGDDEHQFTDEELAQVIIVDDMLFRHKVLRINYTTYDMRRDQDSLNSGRHADIMVLAHENSDTSYWFARILGTFHVRVLYTGPGAPPGPARERTMDFVWVRWLAKAADYEGGWAKKRLPRVGFINPKKDDSPAFGFLDPKHIIRGVHLIPVFGKGRSSNGMRNTIARPETDNGTDWNYFHVNIFVDRDMIMRFRGDGVGHIATHDATKALLRDRDALDIPPDPGTESSGSSQGMETGSPEEDEEMDAGEDEDDNEEGDDGENEDDDGEDDDEDESEDDDEDESEDDDGDDDDSETSDGDGGDSGESDHGDDTGQESGTDEGSWDGDDDDRFIDPDDLGAEDGEDRGDLLDELDYAPL